MSRRWWWWTGSALLAQGGGPSFVNGQLDLSKSQLSGFNLSFWMI